MGGIGFAGGHEGARRRGVDGKQMRFKPMDSKGKGTDRGNWKGRRGGKTGDDRQASWGNASPNNKLGGGGEKKEGKEEPTITGNALTWYIYKSSDRG